MKIAAVLNAHEVPLLLDTVDSIRTYLTSDILVVIDGAKKSTFDNVVLPSHRIDGLRHGVPQSPYRNTALGFLKAYEIWPDADWYCYIEYDCLIGSYRLIEHLSGLPDDVWMLGNDYRVSTDIKLRLVEGMLKTSFDSTRYLLGCCHFMRRHLFVKLADIDFFRRFLWYTNAFSGGFFPDFKGFDISEHLYPTLVDYFGGKIHQLARFRSETEKWEGNHESYPMRWKPDLDDNVQAYQEAAIMHPLKEIDHPIRDYHRKKRNYARRNIAD